MCVGFVQRGRFRKLGTGPEDLGGTAGWGLGKAAGAVALYTIITALCGAREV